jgi:phage N-6-adenine-methyltransferase
MNRINVSWMVKTMLTNGLRTSTTDLWITPKDLYDRLNKYYNFTLDVCATSENTKCEKYFTKEIDGLSQRWIGTCWMNPPYGRTINRWVEKAYKSSLWDGSTVVCLLPSRTDTRWFHNFCLLGEIRFIKGRLKFSGAKENAPFPSMLVVFSQNKTLQNKLKDIIL